MISLRRAADDDDDGDDVGGDSDAAAGDERHGVPMMLLIPKQPCRWNDFISKHIGMTLS